MQKAGKNWKPSRFLENLKEGSANREKKKMEEGKDTSSGNEEDK
jgi:hypothetical protein